MNSSAVDRPYLGIFLMIGFCAIVPMGDAIAKLLGGIVPMGQLLLVRFAMQALLLTPLVLMGSGSFRMSKRAFRLTVVRTVLQIVGVGAMFTSLRYLPLADALAIAFVMPFFMLLLGGLFLNETIGARRLIACAVGFGGTLCVIQPSFIAVGAPALWPLLVAIVFALFVMVTRQIAKESDPISLQAMSGIVATVILGFLYLVTVGFDIPEISFVRPVLVDGLLLLALGLIGTVAHLLMTWSLRFAPASTVAPIQYLEIPVATVIGWFVFQDLPNGLALFGILVIMGAGLYVLFQERAMAKVAAPDV